MPKVPIHPTEGSFHATIRAMQIKASSPRGFNVATAPLGYSSASSNPNQSKKRSHEPEPANHSNKKVQESKFLSDDVEKIPDPPHSPDVFSSPSTVSACGSQADVQIVKDNEEISERPQSPDVFPTPPQVSKDTSDKKPQTDSLTYAKAKGEGKWTYANGTVFTGTFVNGSKEGYGEMRRADGTLEFQGHFKKSRKNGPGKLFLPDGRMFDATFVDDKMEGFVKVIKEDTTIFRGPFKNDQPHGKCMWITPNGNICNADFVDGLHHGRVDMYTPDGASVFHGQFVEDFPHGHGILILPNGFKYDGEFRKGVPVGPLM